MSLLRHQGGFAHAPGTVAELRKWANAGLIRKFGAVDLIDDVLADALMTIREHLIPPCALCGGTGFVRVHGPEDYGSSFESEECDTCEGTGRRL
jgi:hypothetical protein